MLLSLVLLVLLLLITIKNIDSNIIKSIRSKILSLSSYSSNLVSTSPNVNINTNSNTNSKDGMKFIPPMLLFFLSTCQSCEASSLNPQVMNFVSFNNNIIN